MIKKIVCLFTLIYSPFTLAIENSDWELTLGIAPLIAPEYEGADEYRVIPVPQVEVEYQDTYFFSFFRGLGANLINTRQIQAGPAMTYRLWQDEDSNPALKGLGDIPGTLELGGFINYYLSYIRLGADIKQGVNGHRGAIANFSAEFYGKIGEKISYALGPRYAWADENYMETYFGIDTKQASRSDLDVYSPGAGSKEIGIGGFLGYTFNDRWQVSTFGRLTRLLNPAADSPIVEDEGTPTQLTLAFSLAYTF